MAIMSNPQIFEEPIIEKEPINYIAYTYYYMVLKYNNKYP
jgi:hypothetical protein